MTLKTRTAPDSFVIPVRGALFEVSPLSVSAKDKIFKKHTKTKWERGQRFENMNGPAASCEIFVSTVKNWGEELKENLPCVDEYPDNMDVVDEEGNPIPCTPETKRNFYQRNISLANEVIEKAEEADVSMTEETEKNSSTGEGGSSPQDA